MDFPILNLIDNDVATDWLVKHFHPDGLKCPHCNTSVDQARSFRQITASQLKVYRCLSCDGVYNLYSSTETIHPRPSGTSATGCTKARPGHSWPLRWVSVVRRCIQCAVSFNPMPKRCNRTGPLQTNTPRQTRCSKTQGKKSEPPLNRSDPPRRRANKRRGRGTYANDRPPIVGTVGRQSGQVRLRVVPKTKKQTLFAHVHQFTQGSATVYTDEWQGDLGLNRCHATVCHAKQQWAIDADADGIREIHTNTIEGIWTTVRNFLRPFRGVHKQFLAGYIALCECTLISNASRLNVSQNSSLALTLNMSQQLNAR